MKRLEITSKFSVYFSIDLEDWELDYLDRGVWSLEEVLVQRAAQAQAYELLMKTPRASLGVEYEWNFEPEDPSHRLPGCKPLPKPDNANKEDGDADDESSNRDQQ